MSIIDHSLIGLTLSLCGIGLLVALAPMREPRAHEEQRNDNTTPAERAARRVC